MCVKCVVKVSVGVLEVCVGIEREARTRLKQCGDINVKLRVQDTLRMAGNVL